MALAVLPALRARKMPDGTVTLTQKFVDGMREYLKHWDVPTTVYMEPTHESTTNLDEVAIDPAMLPFKLEVLSYDDQGLGAALAGHQVVLGTVSYRQNHLAALCRSAGVPCAFVSEYSLRTRLEIVRSDTKNPLRMLRRMWWEYNQERLHRAAIRQATGIQCNGTPTYEEYRTINPRPHLYFDTRVTEDMLAGERELEERFEVLKRGGPIRLLFAGRLIAMKGADHLVTVARELRRLGVPFEFTICGGGALEPRIRADVERQQLGDCVKLAGVLEFKNELVPLVKRDVDLFVCCHRSGDPSCTYLETMGCGVPIIGYANDAFRGVVHESGSGWLVPMDRPLTMAAGIAGLARDRGALIEGSRKALEFARRHTFEQVFRGRIEHLKECAEAGAVRTGRA